MAARRIARLRSLAAEARATPALLRFSGAVEQDPAVDEWLDEQPSDLGAIARNWFSLMRQCGGDVRELIHDGCPVACVTDAPFGYVNVFRAHVNVGFFHGAALIDPVGLLEGTGKHMRHVKVRPGGVLDALALQTLIAASYRDIRARLGLFELDRARVRA